MFKIDRIGFLKKEKKFTICFGILCALLCVYTMLFVLVDLLWIKLGKKKLTLTGIYGTIIAICIIFMPVSSYGVADFIRPYFNYQDNLFLLDPVRILTATTYGVWFLYKGKLLTEGVEEWVIEEKNRKDDDLIPEGRFNYQCREHMLLFGTTGSGKGVTLNHIIKYAIENGQALIMISAKLASTDPYSQLAYIRKLAKKHHRKLYVVSMDPSVEDRLLYNPFKYINKTEMQNALHSMIKSDSYFYKSNFVAWVLSIFKAIKAAGDEVTLAKILSLYEYKNYLRYIKQSVAKGKIKNPEVFLEQKIHIYAKTAENDAANLDLIFDAGEEVFDDKCGRESISIMDALKENAIIYFDLNGVSAKAATSLIGACITSEIQHAAMEYKDPNIEKTVICDEASFYISEMFVSCFALARSAGYKFIISTQGPSDLGGSKEEDKNILSQLINNTNQFGILRVNSPKDADDVGHVIGTIMQVENTRRADGIDYEGTGSIKPVPVMAANPNRFKNLKKREMIYYEKKDEDDYQPHPVLIKWRIDDL